MTSEHLIHTIPPIYDGNSKILILGSFPSVKSREVSFYYGHPQNRFWRVLAAVLGCAVPSSNEEKTALLQSHNIALWDVIKSCDIVGSSDSSIKNVVPNDIGAILSACSIRQIYSNGKTSEKLFNKYIKDTVGRDTVALPSTSPANASYNLERLTDSWSVIKKQHSIKEKRIEQIYAARFFF